MIRREYRDNKSRGVTVKTWQKPTVTVSNKVLKYTRTVESILLKLLYNDIRNICYGYIMHFIECIEARFYRYSPKTYTIFDPECV